MKSFLLFIVLFQTVLLSQSRDEVNFYIDRIRSSTQDPLWDIPKKLWTNPKIILEAVKIDGRCLEFASVKMRNDREIVLAAVSQYGMALEYASQSLRDDNEIVKAAVIHGVGALQYASQRLKNDIDIVKISVGTVGSMLQYASPQLKNNRAIVRMAVKIDGNALEYASPSMCMDTSIIRLAIANDFGYARVGLLDYYDRRGLYRLLETANFINNKPIMLELVKSDGLLFQYIPYKYKTDKDVVAAAVSESVDQMRNWPPQLLNNKTVMLAAVKQHGDALFYASKKLKDDKEVVLAAVKQNPDAISSASPYLQIDKDIIGAASIHKNIITPEDVSNHPDTSQRPSLLAISEYPDRVRYISKNEYYVIHIVKFAETLEMIAMENGVKLNELVSWNNMERSEIKIGDELIVNRNCSRVENTGNKDSPSTNLGADEQEKLLDVARQYYKNALRVKKIGDSVLALNNFEEAINKLNEASHLPGIDSNSDFNELSKSVIEDYEIMIANNKTNSPISPMKVLNEKTATEEKYITYAIRRGDTIERISKKFDTPINDIIKWNDLKSNVLKPGLKLKIYQGRE